MGLIEYITVALFKMRHDLPYRVIEILFGYDHVTLSRVVLRISGLLIFFHKFQAVVDEGKRFVCISDDHDSSVHDKELFLMEYKNIVDKVASNAIIGDKAYVGLDEYGVVTPSKRNKVRYKRDR